MIGLPKFNLKNTKLEFCKEINMTRIFITRDISNYGLGELKKRKSVQLDVFSKNRAITRRELLKRVKGVDIIISLLTECIDAKVMDTAGPQLKMIANYAVGFDNIDVKEAKKRKIIVTNTPSDAVNEAVAEHAIALMFALSHRIVEADEYIRKNKYKNWDPHNFLGTDIKEKTIGIIGAGRIGSNIMRRLRDGFDVKLLYNCQTRRPELEKQYCAKFATKINLLKQADIVSLHVPLCQSTHHLISTKELKAMKKSAFLINTARGPVVDEQALVYALQTKQIAGAGLDVFEHEPKISSALLKMNNVILTPHTASATIEARRDMAQILVKNVLAFVNGKRIPNKVK